MREKGKKIHETGACDILSGWMIDSKLQLLKIIKKDRTKDITTHCQTIMLMTSF